MFDLFSELSILEESDEEKYEIKRISKRKESLAEILQKGFSLKDVLIVPINGNPTDWRGERSPSISSTASFMIVYYSGYLSSSYASGVGGVVPGFSICIPHSTGR